VVLQAESPVNAREGRGQRWTASGAAGEPVAGGGVREGPAVACGWWPVAGGGVPYRSPTRRIRVRAPAGTDEKLEGDARDGRLGGRAQLCAAAGSPVNGAAPELERTRMQGKDVRRWVSSRCRRRRGLPSMAPRRSLERTRSDGKGGEELVRREARMYRFASLGRFRAFPRERA
jgi:hypothetical protein